MVKRKKDSEETRRAILASAVRLFLQRGYVGATLQAICKEAGVTTGALFNLYTGKEAVLRELIGYMFRDQFAAASALGPAEDPLMLYGVETALQLHIAELNEALRDIYVMAYSLPTTSELIHTLTAGQLRRIFADSFPDYEEKDFYELEIASGGVMRSYMARPCDMYFTMDRKLTRFYEAALRIYRVPEERLEAVTAAVLAMDLQPVARQVIDDLVQRTDQGL